MKFKPCQMPPLWLAIDIGNTNIHIGVFKEDVLRTTYSVRGCNPEDFIKFLDADIFSKVHATIISSVNPSVESYVTEIIQKRLFVKSLSIGKDIPICFPILTDNPEKVGIDRLVNALAAFERVKGWTLVIDSGTAITIDVVNDQGAFLGGIIAPGVGMASKALNHYTALLPEISISKPANVLGKNTQDAINSGIYWGTIGMVSKLVNMLCDELGTQPEIIATGGNAGMLAQEIPQISAVFPYLILDGIKIAYMTRLSSNTPH
jgi:type III pantothenate kinase